MSFLAASYRDDQLSRKWPDSEWGRGQSWEIGVLSQEKSKPKGYKSIYFSFRFSYTVTFPLLPHQIFIFKGLILLYLSFVVWTSELDSLKKQDLESIICLN